MSEAGTGACPRPGPGLSEAGTGDVPGRDRGVPPVIKRRLRIQCGHYGFPAGTFPAARGPWPPAGGQQLRAGLSRQFITRNRRIAFVLTVTVVAIGVADCTVGVVVSARRDHPADPGGRPAALGPGAGVLFVITAAVVAYAIAEHRAGPGIVATTTALDATVQIQILLLLRELQREFGMSVIFVTHDIGVAVEICDRVAVMYAGEIVEQGTLRQIVRSPIHPYARGLLASTVHGAKRGQRLETIPGTPPSLDQAPASCSFAPRCAFAEARCVDRRPPNVRVGPDRIARCILA